MRSIRKGNDVRNLEILVSRLSVPVTNWEEILNLKVSCFERSRKNYLIAPDVVYKEDGKLRLFFEGNKLSEGVYDLLITFSITDPVMPDAIEDKAIDIQNIFRIVPTTAQEVDSQDPFSVDLNFAKDGLDYYHIWSQYHEGTIEDMFAWHRQPAVDAAAALDLLSQEVTENENARLNAEQIRQGQEATRQQNEATRGTAETARATAETGRVNAESSRVTAEQTRQSQEVTRQQNEATRGTAETARATAETGRVNAESSRVTAEQTRQGQEATRQQNEATRGTAETARATAETGRVNAESLRVTAEQTRSTQEATRQQNETTRGTAETAREAAESTRQQNEQIRMDNEESREERLALKADLVDGTVPAEQLPPELVDTTLYVTNVAHRKRRIKDASEVEDSTALWTLVKGNDYLKALPDILGLGLYLVSQDLTEHNKLSKTNSNFYSDGTPAVLDGSEGDIQMCWRKPIYIKYYEKQEADGLYEHFEISHLNILGDCEMIPPGGGFPAVLDRTTTTLRALYSTDVNFRGGNNASAYDTDPLKTLLGKPASNLSAYTSELYAKKRGDLWTSGGTPFFATLAILQIMFFGTNNSQAAIVSDDVLVDGSGFQRSKIASEGLFEGSFGVNNAFPNWDTYNAYNPTFDLSAGFEHGDITGRRVYTISDWPTPGTTQTIQLAYFFGMPWPFNHMWYGDAHQRVDQQTVEQGFKTVVYQKRDITTAPISGGPSSNGVIPPAPWEKVAEAYRGSGYIRRVSWDGLSMIPTEAAGAGGASTFYCDYLYNNGETSFGWRAPLRFAHLPYGSNAGAFSVHVNSTPTAASAYYGAFCCHFTEGIAPRKIVKSFF